MKLKHRFLQMGILFLGGFSQFAIAVPIPDQAYDDWIPDSNYLCQGHYEEPPLSVLKDPLHPPLEITYDKGSWLPKGTSHFKGDVVAQEGHRVVRADEGWLTQNSKTGDTEWIKGRGRVKITEPGLRIDGTEADVDAINNHRFVQHAHYRLYERHIRGYALELKTLGPDRMELEEGSYTTCAPHQNTWALSSKHLKFNQETGRGEAWRTKLYLQNVPVFYWPYVNFPIDDRRQTGFLNPSLSNNSIFGATVITPFYWNIAPQYDATIIPHFTAKRGLRLDQQFRYLTPHNNGALEWDLLPHDRSYQTFRRTHLLYPEKIPLTDPRYTRLQAQDHSHRYRVRWQHQTLIHPSTEIQVDYNKISDDNFMQHFGSANSLYLGAVSQNAVQGVPFGNGDPASAVQATLALQQILATHGNAWGNLSGSLIQYQVLHPFQGPQSSEPYRKLPEVSWNSANFDGPLGIQSKWNASYTDWKVRSMPSIEKITDGQRLHFRPALMWPYVEPAGFIRPRIQLDLLGYDLNLSRTDRLNSKADQVSRAIPLYDVDAGLVFERPLQIDQQNYLQTLEPRLYYLKVPRHDQTKLPIFDTAATPFDYAQLWRDNRYVGVDRVGDTHQLSMGVSTGFFDDQTGSEKARLGIGQTLYFQDRRIHVLEVINHHVKKPAEFTNGILTRPGDVDDHRLSPLAGIADYRMNERWVAGANATLSLSDYKFNTVGFSAQYHDDGERVVNLGYQLQKDNLGNLNAEGHPLPVQQFHVSTAWRLTPSWVAFGKVGYDVEQQRLVQSLVGFEQQGCCTLFRVGWIQNLHSFDQSTQRSQYDHAFMIQLVFKGFTSVGNVGSSYFSDQISGYRPLDTQY